MTEYKDGLDALIGDLLEAGRLCIITMGDEESVQKLAFARENIRKAFNIAAEKSRPVFKRTLIGTGSLIEIPKKLAVCPYCQGQLTARFEGWVQLDDKTWAADDVQLDCETEPQKLGSDAWESWQIQHSEMPYVYMLPVEEKVKAWINRHFFFEL